MKKARAAFLLLFSVVLLCFALKPLTLLAAVEPPVNKDEVLLYCVVEDGNQLMVLRNPSTDIFTILYGEDVNNPIAIVAKRGNDIGTTYTEKANTSFSNREIYVSEKGDFITVGVTADGGRAVTAYYVVQTSEAKAADSKCKPETIVSKFGEHLYFTSMTEVD